jgi:hypothetical protein
MVGSSTSGTSAGLAGRAMLGAGRPIMFDAMFWIARRPAARTSRPPTDACEARRVMPATFSRRRALGIAAAALVPTQSSDPPRSIADVMRAFRRAYEALDPHALEALLSSDFEYSDPTFHVGANGILEMRSVMADAVKGLASVSILVEHEIVCDPWVVARQRMAFVHKPAAGRRIDVRGVSLLRIESGLIREWHDYYDAVGVRAPVARAGLDLTYLRHRTSGLTNAATTSWAG